MRRSTGGAYRRPDQCAEPSRFRCRLGSGGRPGTNAARGLGCGCWAGSGEPIGDVAAGAGAGCAGNPTGGGVGAATGAGAGVATGAGADGAAAVAPGAVTRNPLMMASVAGPSATAVAASVVTANDTRYLSGPDVAMT